MATTDCIVDALQAAPNDHCSPTVGCVSLGQSVQGDVSKSVPFVREIREGIFPERRRSPRYTVYCSRT